VRDERKLIQLGALAGLGQEDHHVARLYHGRFAMQGIRRVYEERRRSARGQEVGQALGDGTRRTGP
jgi:hypothetical protein